MIFMCRSDLKQFRMIVWSTVRKYGKLIHGIVLLGAMFVFVNYQDNIFPVNRNAFEDLIQYELEAANATTEIEYGGVAYTIPANKRFGQEFTEEDAEEARRVYAGAKTLPYKVKPLLAIIKEETAYYFDGAKSMEEVITLVQNRVQLYLDEHKVGR